MRNKLWSSRSITSFLFECSATAALLKMYWLIFNSCRFYNYQLRSQICWNKLLNQRVSDLWYSHWRTIPLTNKLCSIKPAITKDTSSRKTSSQCQEQVVLLRFKISHTRLTHDYFFGSTIALCVRFAICLFRSHIFSIDLFKLDN